MTEITEDMDAAAIESKLPDGMLQKIKDLIKDEKPAAPSDAPACGA